MNYSKSQHRKEIDSFVFAAALLITFIPSEMQFYVNTLRGGYVFRKASLDIFRILFQKIKCR